MHQQHAAQQLQEKELLAAVASNKAKLLEPLVVESGEREERRGRARRGRQSSGCMWLWNEGEGKELGILVLLS